MGQSVATSPVEPAVHKHVQIREHVRALLEGSSPGTPAPSERELVQQFGVARMTVRQALDTLVAEGLLERVPGRGTFVAHNRAAQSAVLTSFSEEMRRRGMVPGSRTLLARSESAGPGVARALEISEGEPIIHWQRLRTADEAPVCIEDAFIPVSLVPGMLDNLPESLYAELERRHLAPTSGEDSVEAGLASGPEARAMGVDPGQPVLRIARRAFADRQPLTVARSVYRGDRYAMWVPMTRAPRR